MPVDGSAVEDDMNTPTNSSKRFLIVALAILTGATTPASGAPDANSTLTTIDVPGSTSTLATDINAEGEIVGRYVSGADGLTHGFLRNKHGDFTTINFPGAVFTVAAGINALGDIVGMYRLPTDSVRVRHGFLLSGGAFTTIDPPGAVFTNALGINASGRDRRTFLYDGRHPVHA